MLANTSAHSGFHTENSELHSIVPNFGADLTVRETECLHWVAAGKTSSEIAQISRLSEHTVNHYLSSCCRKLDAVNRIQAAVKAVRAGII